MDLNWLLDQYTCSSSCVHLYNRYNASTSFWNIESRSTLCMIIFNELESKFCFVGLNKLLTFTRTFYYMTGRWKCRECLWLRKP